MTASRPKGPAHWRFGGRKPRQGGRVLAHGRSDVPPRRLGVYRPGPIRRVWLEDDQCSDKNSQEDQGSVNRLPVVRHTTSWSIQDVILQGRCPARRAHVDRPGSPAPVRITDIAMTSPPPIPGFRPVPFTGVIFVMAEAGRRGYRYGHPDWCNLGQGQPETGPLPGAPPRVQQIEIGVDDQDYAPVPGIWELRRAVAELYNSSIRGRESAPSYTERNVCICGGGRASLTRAVAALGQVNLGHFLPDYTAYEELLDIFKLFTSIPILLDGGEGYHFSLETLRARDHRPRTLGAAAVQPLQPDRQARHRRCGARGMGRGSRASSAARSWSTSSTRTTSGARRRMATGWSRRRDTWTTWMPTRSCSSTA